MRKRIVSLFLAMLLLFTMIPTTVWAEAPIDTGEGPAEDSLIACDENCEFYDVTRLYASNQPMLFYAPSTTTVGINVSDFSGYTNTATGQQMCWHFIKDGSGNLDNGAWCIEPGAPVFNGESYSIDGIINNQTLKDVLQIAYEWGWWSNVEFYVQYVAATQIAVWWALGYTNASCSVSGVDADASTLYYAALADAGCGGGELFAYECTTNSSHQRLATYYPYRNVTTEYGDIKIVKSSANPDITNGSDCYSLQGAVYGIYSSKANAQNDRNRLDTLTTNANGVTGVSVDLEAGYNYYVKEITAPKGYALDNTVYTVMVTANHTITLEVKDEPQADPVSVVLKKVDAYTGLEYAQGNASLEGAEYTVRFYNALYDTVAEAEASGPATRTWVLRTNENGFCYLDTPWLVSGDDFYMSGDGFVTLPIGTVLMQETKAPEGYFINDEVYIVHITETGNDQATIGAYNAPITPEYVLEGNIQITKTTKTGRDRHTVMEDGAQFEIFLKSAGSYAAANETDKALVTTDANGIAFVEGLPYGTYTVHQISGWPGSKLAPDFDVTIDVHEETYTYAIENERFYSTVQLVKVDSVTGDPIPVAGVGFQIRYPDGTPFTLGGEDTWYTDDTGTLTLPEELEYGIGYMAIELNAPTGYVLPVAAHTFDVTEALATTVNGAPLVIAELKNQPTIVEIAKVDAAGGAVSGAKMQLLDDNGDLVEEWVSSNTPRTFYALPIGSTYTVREAEAPAGFVKANDVSFTVQDTFEVQTITMTDKQVLVQKTDAAAAPLSGAKLQVVDASAAVIDEWTSDGTPHAVNGLVIGQSYTLHEESAPEGYAKAKDVTFTVAADNATQRITLVDKQVLVAKTDSSDVPLSGAKMQMLDASGNVVDEWTTSSVSHAVSGLSVGVTYTLRETSAPEGYVAAGDKQVTVTDDDTDQSITVVDKQVKVKKVDPFGNAFSGAKLQVLDASGNVVDEWTSDGTEHAVKGLVAGKTYTLREVSAPTGWMLIPDTTFVVADDGKEQILTVENEEQPVIGTIATVDGRHDALAAGKEITLKDVVAYEKLIPGREYVVKGVLMDKATKKALVDKDGNEITASTTFIPVTSSGSVELTFKYTPVPGSTVVVFENLYRNTRLVATHADIDDADQTVTFPAIKTTATIGDKKEAYRSTTMKLVDKVEYSGLTVGKEYTIKGMLMNKKSGEALVDKNTNQYITATLKFTPTESSGYVEVPYEFNGYSIASSSIDIVVFEELYDGEYLLAEHEDINDAGQTVKMRVYVPYSPPPQVESPDSGDIGIVPFVIAMALAAFGSILVIRKYILRVIPAKEQEEDKLTQN